MTDHSIDEPLREFNLSGCFIVLLAFSINVLWGGVYKALGVLLPTLRDQFTTHTWVVGILIAMMAISADVTGLVTIILDVRFGSRRVLIFSTLMVAVGLVLMHLATSIIHIALALAFLVGPGIGIPVVLTKAILGHHFSNQYTLASGIGHSGHALGLLAFAPMTQLFLDTYGWRGSVLLLGGICMHPVACAAIVRAPKEDYLPLQDQREQTSDGTSSVKAFFIRINKALDLQILTEFNFWIVYLCLSGLRFVNNTWLEFYVPQLENKGFTPQVSAAICSAAGVGFILGTVIFAPVVDRNLLKSSTGVIINSLTLTFSFLLNPWLNDIPGLVVITFIFGLSSSALFTLIDVLTKDLVGSNRLTSAFGWCAALGAIISFLAGFLPGWIYDTTGSYDLAFIVIGLAPTGALLPLVITKLRHNI